MLIQHVFLGLGSNIGDRAAHLRAAMQELSAYVEIHNTSSIFETDALLPEGAPPEWNQPFFNVVIAVKTGLSPQQLLTVIKAIEASIGRQDRGRWGPREVDIDIVAMDDVVYDEPNLTIPHKELAKRSFVLLPLAQIAPDWRHPILGKTARELADAIDASDARDTGVAL